MAQTTENPPAKKSMMAANVTKPGRRAAFAAGCDCPPAALLVGAGLVHSLASSGGIASDILRLRFLQNSSLAQRSPTAVVATGCDRLRKGALHGDHAPNPTSLTRSRPQA